MITAYPMAGKEKSYMICEAFVQGCKGKIVQNADKLAEGPAFFYGVGKGNLHLWEQIKADPSKEFYYCDNSYFDSTRQEYYRVTKNRLQHQGYGKSDGLRFKELGVAIKPWQPVGEHIVVCPQSESFMKEIVGYETNWCDDTINRLRKLFPKIPLRVRNWNRDKGALSSTLKDDLKGASFLITWSSAAANTALLEGVPVVCDSVDCVAKPLSGDLNNPYKYLDTERLGWAQVLADNQWTLAEFRSGLTWRTLCQN